MFTELCVGNGAEMVLLKEEAVIFYTVSTLTCWYMLWHTTHSVFIDHLDCLSLCGSQGMKAGNPPQKLCLPLISLTCVVMFSLFCFISFSVCPASSPSKQELSSLKARALTARTLPLFRFLFFLSSACREFVCFPFCPLYPPLSLCVAPSFLPPSCQYQCLFFHCTMLLTVLCCNSSATPCSLIINIYIILKKNVWMHEDIEHFGENEQK